MDAGKSYDPEGGELSYHWYGPFFKASGKNPTVVIQEGRYNISLIVDDGEKCSTIDTTTIVVNPAFPLTLKMNDNAVQLNWKLLENEISNNHTYTIYRTDHTQPYNFQQVGSTLTKENEYVDSTVNNDKTYLYVIGKISENNSLFSDVQSIHTTISEPIENKSPSKSCDTGDSCFLTTVIPVVNFNTPSVTGNNPPVIWSPPVLHAETMILYNYDVNATDPDNNVLTYSLYQCPEGMTIDKKSGLISWIPKNKGTYVIIVQVDDAKGGIDTQTFTVNVRQGISFIKMPDLMGMAKQIAEDKIIEQGLLIRNITWQLNNNFPAETVVNQFPAKNVSIKIGSSVDIVLSFTQMINVPDIVGQTIENADNVLIENNLQLGNITEKFSENVPTGIIMVQDPAAGNSVVLGAKVNVVVSTGIEKVMVPNLIGEQYIVPERKIDETKIFYTI